MTTHDTILLGFRDNKLCLVKTFDYPNEKEQAQSDLKHVIDNYDGWIIGQIDNMVKGGRLTYQEDGEINKTEIK